VVFPGVGHFLQGRFVPDEAVDEAHLACAAAETAGSQGDLPPGPPGDRDGEGVESRLNTSIYGNNRGDWRDRDGEGGGLELVCISISGDGFRKHMVCLWREHV
jgi:hypothetical protein